MSKVISTTNAFLQTDFNGYVENFKENAIQKGRSYQVCNSCLPCAEKRSLYFSVPRIPDCLIRGAPCKAP